MSTEQSLDPQLIEQTKQQIRALVNEIAQLSKSELSPAEFYGEFLTRVVSALAAYGGAVWTANDEGRLALQFQINLEQTNLRQNEDAQRKHSRLLTRVFKSGEGGLVPPHSGAGDDAESGNPTDFLLVLGALKTDVGVQGVVEVFQRADTGLNTQKGYLRFLLQMCDLAGDFLKSRQLRHFSDRQSLWSQLEDFTKVVHASLHPRETSYTIANEGRRLIDCDRVSVAIRRGHKCLIEAVSGQDLFDKRSNTIRLLGKLATEVVAAGEPLWYTGDTHNLAPQIEDAVQEYVDEAHTKMIAVLPLARDTVEGEDEQETRENQERPFGALIVEQIEDSRIPETMKHRVNVVARHSASALANSLEYSDLFLMPVWRALGKTKVVLRARTLPKVVAISVGVVFAILFMIFFPADFTLQAKGTIEPVYRWDVYARSDGVVDELFVKHGDLVQAGQLLAKLRNTELEVALQEVTGKLATVRQRTLSLEREVLEGKNRMTPEERSRVLGQLMEGRQELNSLNAQYTLYTKKKEDLVVKSPAKGRIVTWDLQNRLIERPVQRGQVLMRVADTDADWQLELRMPEDRMGHIAKAQQKLGYELPVTYILATEPGSPREGTVKEVHLSAEVREEEGSSVLTKVKIDKNELGALRPGMNVTAKVYCGRRSIGYVWFHDLVAFIQSRVIFPW
jgi:multidrug efflux pump subunit AcrA (membrane-fusion protein)